MQVLYETQHFVVYVPDNTHIDRLDGGHIIIDPKDENITDRTQISSAQANELMQLTIMIGKAMKTGLSRRGIEIERINYQENGNWRPKLRNHLYGRAVSAKTQKCGEALHFPKPETGFYDDFEPLNEEDCKEIMKEIQSLEPK